MPFSILRMDLFPAQLTRSSELCITSCLCPMDSRLLHVSILTYPTRNPPSITSLVRSKLSKENRKQTNPFTLFSCFSFDAWQPLPSRNMHFLSLRSLQHENQRHFMSRRRSIPPIATGVNSHLYCQRPIDNTAEMSTAHKFNSNP